MKGRLSIKLTHRQPAFHRRAGLAALLALREGGRQAFLPVTPTVRRLIMVIPKHSLSIVMATALAMVSCGPLNQRIVVKVPDPKKEEPTVVQPVVPEPGVPTPPVSDIRMPDMLDLPGEGEFRPTSPGVSKPGESGAVISSRPPTDPPSRVKPKEAGAE